MIIRGIISEMEVEKINEAASKHGLKIKEPGSFQTWTKDCAIWVEVDVNEDVMTYLKQSGFFDGIE